MTVSSPSLRQRRVRAIITQRFAFSGAAGRSRARVLSILFAVALLPGMARAEVSLYGTAHISVDFAGNGDHDPATRKSTVQITSEQSDIGLRGREGLSDQLFLVWQGEHGVDLDDGRFSAPHDSYVGLEGSAGTVRAGRYATPYRQMTERLDIFADTRADYNALIGSVPYDTGTPETGVAYRSLFNQRARNILSYATPEDKRVRFSAAYIVNQQSDDLPMTDRESEQDGFSLALVFDSGPLYAGVAFERLGQEKSPTQEDAMARKAALGWDFREGTRLALIWEEASNGVKVGSHDESRSAWYFNLSHVSGNATFKAAYGMVEDLSGVSDSGAHMAALGFSYALSRRTDIYLLATGIANRKNGLYALQPDQDDPDSVIAPAAAGDDVFAFSGGLVHRFDVGL